MIAVFVNKRPWKLPGPILNVAVRNAHSLAALGIETHLIVAAPDQPTNWKEDLAGYYGVPTGDPFTVHLVPRPAFLGMSWGGAAVFRAATARIAEMAQRDRVLVVTRDAGFLPQLAGLCRNPAVTGLYESHDFYPQLAWRERFSLQDVRQGFLERRYLPRIHGLVCITVPQRQLYRALFPRVPMRTLTLGTSPFPEPPDLESRRLAKEVVYIGHLHGYKGVTALIKSAKLLVEHGIKMRFIGGTAGQVARFSLQAARCGVEDIVRFQPFVPPHEMHHILAREASLGIIPLQDTFYNRHLTCPAKGLDYIAHGLPVVASDLPSVVHALGGAAAVYPPGDHKAMRARIKAILASPETYRRFAELSQAQARRLAWPERAQRLVRFAEKVSQRATG